MSDLKQASLPDLIDLLSIQTANYTTMIRTGATQEEFDRCGEEINRIQLEIAIRKSIKDQLDTNNTPSNISYTRDSPDAAHTDKPDNLN